MQRLHCVLFDGCELNWYFSFFHCRIFLQVNVLGVCVFTREFMTQLKERGVNEGHIININR